MALSGVDDARDDGFQPVVVRPVEAERKTEVRRPDEEAIDRVVGGDLRHPLHGVRILDLTPDGIARVRRRSDRAGAKRAIVSRSEEHTSELQSLMRISYAVFCLKKQTRYTTYRKNE